MASDDKLIQKIRNNPKDVRFAEACKAAEMIGFVGSEGKGSHTVYKRVDEFEIFNFQNRNGRIPTYQAKQLIALIDKYWHKK
jgi:hypothetical protein